MEVALREWTELQCGDKTYNFPFPSARPRQLETAGAVIDQINAGNDVLLEASTGTGKSPIALTIAKAYSGAWVIVGDRNLVEQYKRDYDGLRGLGFLKSRQSFMCPVIGDDTTCADAEGPCRRARDKVAKFAEAQAAGGAGLKCDLLKPGETPEAWQDRMECPYERNRNWALSQPITIMTTAMAITIFTYLRETDYVGFRPLVIVDEASELENELLGFYTVSFSSARASRHLGMGPFFTGDTVDPEALHLRRPMAQSGRPDPKVLQSWAESLRHFADVALSSETLAPSEERALSGLRNRAATILTGIADGVPFYVEIKDDTENQANMFDAYLLEVKPLEAIGMFNRLMDGIAERALFLSATPGTTELFKATHGLSSNLISMHGGTPFPAENRPIYIRKAGDLSAKSINTDLPKVADYCVLIANHEDPNGRFDHRNQKGVIHTHNMRVMEAIAAALGGRAVTLSGGGPQRMETLERFLRDPAPRILVSPSAHIGISLSGDLARWQIIAKAPFAFLGDPAVQHRKERIKGWYAWQTTKNMIQAFGRAVRSPDDWAITYVVDASAANHLKWNRPQVPNYVWEAIVW